MKPSLDSVEGIVEDTTCEYLYVNEYGEDVIVSGTWDDLNPEPERTEVKQALQAVQQALQEHDFTVSDVQSQYGAARIHVLSATEQ